MDNSVVIVYRTGITGFLFEIVIKALRDFRLQTSEVSETSQGYAANALKPRPNGGGGR